MAVRAHFHRHLIGGAAHAAGLDFEMGLHVFESLFEGAQRFFAGLFGEDFKGAIENLFGGALLAVVHETVHETGGQAAAINRIRQNFPSGDGTFTGHENSPGNAGALRQGVAVLCGFPMRRTVRAALVCSHCAPPVAGGHGRAPVA